MTSVRAIRKLQKDKNKYHAAIGLSKIFQGNAITRTLFQVSRSTCCYWQKKIVDLGFHSNKHGGPRVQKLKEEEKQRLEILLFSMCRQNALFSLNSYHRRATDQGFQVSKSYIARIFRSWRWSFHKPTRYQFQKFTHQNIQYYGEYIISIQKLPWKSLKFVDEASFSTRKLLGGDTRGEKSYVEHKQR